MSLRTIQGLVGSDMLIQAPIARTGARSPAHCCGWMQGLQVGKEQSFPRSAGASVRARAAGLLAGVGGVITLSSDQRLASLSALWDTSIPRVEPSFWPQ